MSTYTPKHAVIGKHRSEETHRAESDRREAFKQKVDQLKGKGKHQQENPASAN